MSTLVINYKRAYLIQVFARKILFTVVILFVIVSNLFSTGDTALFTLLIGGLFLFFIWRKASQQWAQLRGKLPALLVSAEGFIDYTTSYQVGIVRWEEVASVASYGFFPLTKSIRVLLKQPKELLRREESGLHRGIMTYVTLLFKTPFVWESKLLAPSHKELLRLLQEAKAGTYDFDNLGQHLIEQ